jgi:hypothetical protein
MFLNSNFYLFLWKGGKDMKGMTFKKALLLSGIFLLSTFMLVQLSWGCDDDDKWDRDCHNKWDCHKHGKPCQPLVIQSVDVDLTNNEILIHGQNFDNGAHPPVVTLGGGIELAILTYTGNEIVAELPALEDIPDSDYRLVVSTCHDSACKDKHCKDHGSNCKCKYCKDHEYKCKCKDKYSLTIPGPPGPTGPPGTIESVIVENAGAFDNPTTPRKIDGHAYCDTAGGYTVTGGGFKSNNIKIIESRADGNGWYVLGRITNDDSEDPVALTIYAVCAKIK